MGAASWGSSGGPGRVVSWPGQAVSACRDSRDYHHHQPAQLLHLSPPVAGLHAGSDGAGSAESGPCAAGRREGGEGGGKTVAGGSGGAESRPASGCLARLAASPWARPPSTYPLLDASRPRLTQMILKLFLVTQAGAAAPAVPPRPTSSVMAALLLCCLPPLPSPPPGPEPSCLPYVMPCSHPHPHPASASPCSWPISAPRDAMPAFAGRQQQQQGGAVGAAIPDTR